MIKIIDNTVQKSVPFVSLKQGDIFKFAGETYIKTEQCDCTMGSTELCLNALNLKSFIISCLDSRCQVEPIRSILTLDY